jgi:hypothetical protein
MEGNRCISEGTSTGFLEYLIVNIRKAIAGNAQIMHPTK